MIMTHTHIKTLKFKGQSVQKDRVETDGRINRQTLPNCFTFPPNAVVKIDLKCPLKSV